MGNGQAKKARQAKAIINAPIQAERDKQIAWMIAEEKKSMNQVARELGLSSSTVHAAYHRYLNDTRSITQETVNAYRLEQLDILNEVTHALLDDMRKGSRERKVLEPLGKFLHQRAMLLGLYPTTDKAAQPHNINIVFVAGDGVQSDHVDANVVEGFVVAHEDADTDSDR